MAGIHGDAIRFRPALVEQRARPERVSVMAQRGRCGEIRLPPFLVDRHAGRDFAQRLEAMHPEIFFKVQIAVIALCGARIRAEQ